MVLVRVYKRRSAFDPKSSKAAMQLENGQAWEGGDSYLHDSLSLAILSLRDRLWNELRLSLICDIGLVNSCWLSSNLDLDRSWHFNFLHGSRGPSLRLSLAVPGNCLRDWAESCGVRSSHGGDMIGLIWLLLCHGLGNIVLDLLYGSRCPCLRLRLSILCDCLRNWAESGGIRSLGFRDVLSLVRLLDRLDFSRLYCF